MLGEEKKSRTLLCYPIAKECVLKNFSLEHQPYEDFVKSQWQKQTRSLNWLIYRWLLAAFFIASVCDTVIVVFYHGKLFIYLTAWGFFLCMVTSTFGAVLVSIYYWRPDRFAVPVYVLKCYWACYWTTLVLAAVITLVYWVLLYPFNDATGIGLIYNLFAHASNSILMILDHMLVAFPTRILHFVYVIGLGVIYTIFTLIYYFAGGVDIYGNHYIYRILNWTQPGLALATIIACIILLLVINCLLFSLYKLRCIFYRKLSRSAAVPKV